MGLDRVSLRLPRGGQRVIWLLAPFAALAFILLLGSFLVRVLEFAHLFGVFKPHSGNVFTQQQVADTDTQRHQSAPGKQVVPMILHQVFHNWKNPQSDEIPKHWNDARQSCIDLNPSWDIKLWNLTSSRTFIEIEYPWFLSTYDNYKLPIQRVDTMKYFLLRHYGGVYLDMDNGCNSSLEPLLYYPAFVIDSGIGALGNNIMGGQPAHPFYHLLTDNLESYNWNYPFPYLAITYASGQWFVTAMWEKYHYLLRSDGTFRDYIELGAGFKPLDRILMSDRPEAQPSVFFSQTMGGTWRNWDNRFFEWLGDHTLLIAISITVPILLLFRRCCLYAKNSKKLGYRSMESDRLSSELIELERV